MKAAKASKGKPASASKPKASAKKPNGNGKAAAPKKRGAPDVEYADPVRVAEALGVISDNVTVDAVRHQVLIHESQSLVEQAAAIIKVLDREDLSVRDAHDRTGIAAADFSRIRHADLGRFTVDRLMSIINRLGSRVEMTVTVRRTKQAEHGAPA